MRWAAVGRAPPKLEFNPPNEERASRRLSGKVAGLYKRPAGRTLALVSCVDLFRELVWGGGLRPLRQHLRDDGGGR